MKTRTLVINMILITTLLAAFAIGFWAYTHQFQYRG
jgi:hypothetical protein